MNDPDIAVSDLVFAPAGAVNGGSNRLRAAHGRAHYDLIHGLLHTQTEAFQHLCQGGLLVFFRDCAVSISVAVTIGQGVAARAFEQLELVHVARERGLCDLDPAPSQFAP